MRAAQSIGGTLLAQATDPAVQAAPAGRLAKRVRQVYGQRLSVHAYSERGLVLAVYSPDKKIALVMESNDAGRIVTLRGAMVPAVEFLEGCSA